MKRFKYLVKEYYLDSFPSSYELSSHGTDGWELVETVKGIKKGQLYPVYTNLEK